MIYISQSGDLFVLSSIQFNISGNRRRCFCCYLLPLRGNRFIRMRALRIFALCPVDMNRRSFFSFAPLSRPGLLMNGGTMLTWSRSEADNLWRGSFCSLAICSLFRLWPGELSGVTNISLNAATQTVYVRHRLGCCNDSNNRLITIIHLYYQLAVSSYIGYPHSWYFIFLQYALYISWDAGTESLDAGTEPLDATQCRACDNVFYVSTCGRLFSFWKWPYWPYYLKR